MAARRWRQASRAASRTAPGASSRVSSRLDFGQAASAHLASAPFLFPGCLNQQLRPESAGNPLKTAQILFPNKKYFWLNFSGIADDIARGAIGARSACARSLMLSPYPEAGPPQKIKLFCAIAGCSVSPPGRVAKATARPDYIHKYCHREFLGTPGTLLQSI